MTIVRDVQAKWQRLKAKRAELLLIDSLATKARGVSASESWPDFVEQLGKWAGMHQDRLLRNECDPYDQGYSQGVLSAIAQMKAIGQKEPVAVRDEIEAIDRKLEWLQNRLGADFLPEL